MPQWFISHMYGIDFVCSTHLAITEETTDKMRV